MAEQQQKASAEKEANNLVIKPIEEVMEEDIITTSRYSGQIFALFIFCKEAKKISNSLQKQKKKAKKILLIKIKVLQFSKYYYEVICSKVASFFY